MELPELRLTGQARRRVEGALQRLSHGYIISGGSPGGREELARFLAAAYLCAAGQGRPCGRCGACRKVAEGVHPDVICAAPAQGRRGITVEQVRLLRAQAYVRPNEGARKVFVLRDAQTMNDSAQNALLKVLEEGPDYLALLLLCPHPQQLLPTIRSRCEGIALPPAPGEEGPGFEELAPMARELAALLTAGDELKLAEHAAGLEGKKWDEETLDAFLGQVEDALREQLPARPGQLLPLMERLGRARRAIPFHVGAGHLLGWLAAGEKASEL